MSILTKIIELQAPIRSILKLPFYNSTTGRFEYPSGTAIPTAITWDGTNIKDSTGTIIDGIFTAADITALNLITPTLGLAGVVSNPGNNGTTNTTLYPWAVYADGVKWNIFGGKSSLARMTTSRKVIRPAATFTAAYTVDSNAGDVRISSAGAHGLTTAVAVGKMIYVSAGTLTGLHEVKSLDADTTGVAITLTTAYSGTPTATAIAVAATDEIKVWEVTVPALRAASSLIIPMQMYNLSGSGSRTLLAYYGGTSFRESTPTTPGTTVNVFVETVINNTSLTTQVARSPKTNNNDGGSFSAAPITGAVNTATTQTLSLRMTLANANEWAEVMASAEVIW